MTKQAIIYSPSNLDSCLASAILQMGFKDIESDIKPFSYNRGGNTFDPPVGFEVVYVLGADLTSDDMLALLDANGPSTVFYVFNYSNSTVYPARMLSPMDESHRFKIITDDGGDGFKISVSSRICSFLTDNDIKHLDKRVTVEGTLIKDYAGVVSLYTAFKPMTALQTLFLYSNLNNVRKAASGAQALSLEEGKTPAKTQQYDEYVQDVRVLVKANMAMAYYAGANGAGYHTPTICVGERDAMHAMRFISYAHDEVISYEDTRSARVYRVLSKNNMQWYIKRFEPRDIWSEGSLTYFKTDLLQHVR